MANWYEDDDFWLTGISPMLHERLDQAPVEVEGVLSLAGIAPPAAALDLCCGIGRHSLELARRGFNVTGVDRTREFLDEARRSAEADGLQIEFVEQDMRRFRRPDTYDLAINLLTSFGYFEDPEEDRLVAQNLYDSLKAGGALVLDLMGKENLARIFKPREWSEKEGEIWLYERRVTDAWSWLENRWVLIKDGKLKEFTLSHRVYSAAELSRLLEECGFSSIDVFGDLNGAPFDHEASRLVLVARK